mgnify:CR=1 FL=1
MVDVWVLFQFYREIGAGYMRKTDESIAVVILAAGEARRFGSPKQLAVWNGLPLLQAPINLVRGLGFKPWVALGAHRVEILECADLNFEDCKIIEVNDWAIGLSVSIKASLKALQKQDEEVKGVIFLLADQPLLSTADLDKLLQAISENSDQIICSGYLLEGLPSVGVPAYFPRQYFDELMSLSGDKGAKKVIVGNQHTIISMNKHLCDIDTPEDLSLLVSLIVQKCAD